MKRTRHRPEQISAKLREADALLGGGPGVGQVCQKLGVTEQTFPRWWNQYAGMKAAAKAQPDCGRSRCGTPRRPRMPSVGRR